MFKRIAALWWVVRGDARVLWHALRHPLAPGWLKPAVMLVAAYVLWPVDLVPEFVPALGVVDDLVLVPLAMRWLIARLPPALRAELARRTP